MTTKPKANRFRLRAPQIKPKQPETAAAQSVPQASEPKQAPPVTPTKPQARPQPQQQATQQTTQDQDQSGLTARQLRMARRVAQKHGLAFTSDYDAVQQLRAKGIDPFQRSSMLEMATEQSGGHSPTQLPAKIDPVKVPAGQAGPDPAQAAAERAKEIMQIQRDLARRRRRNIVMLLARLSLFVFLPTLAAGIYFFTIATPMYSSKSAFQIITADSGGGGGGMGGLFAGTGLASTQDAVAVQTYLKSKEALVRLDEEVGYMAHFKQDSLDPLQRLAQDATLEDAHKLYNKHVKIGYDPTEGLINLEVITADPQESVKFSQALGNYAEEKVESLSKEKRENQVADARAAFEEAEQARRDAQEALVQLQQTTLLDPEAYAGSLRQQVSTLDQQIIEKELQLEALLDNARPNESRVNGVRADIERLNAAKAESERKMQEPMENGMTLAELVSRIQIAQADLGTRDAMLQGALETLRATQAEANSQTRYLARTNEPIAAQSASYPRAFEDTILAFLIFAGIYLMISITASILREQMS